MPDLIHWIITNREVVEGPAGEERVDPSVHAASPEFRIARYTPAPTTDKTPREELDARVAFVPDEHVASYADVRPGVDPQTLVASKQLFAALYHDMCDADPAKGDTLFFIHGFNYGWHDAVRHLQRLHEVYAEPAQSPIRQIVYFTWPSFGEQTRYPSDQEIAQPSGWLLGRVFAKAVQFYREFFEQKKRPAFCGRKIHIAAHSMGNQVLQEFMRAVRDYAHLRAPIFGEALLLNADADWTALELGQPLHDLHEYCQRMHVYNHFSDDALAISEATKNERKRLGRHGPRDLKQIPPRTVVVDCSGLSGQSSGPAAPGSFLAVARQVLKGHPTVSIRERLFDHWGYLHRPEVVADLYEVMRGTSSAAMPSLREHVSGPLFRLKEA